MEITITSGWSIIIGITLLIILWNFYTTIKDKNRLQNKLTETESSFKVKQAELKVSSQQWAIAEFEKFKQNEITQIESTAKKNALSAATVVLQEWKVENESSIRLDAINRSYAVNLGKITEHLIPFHINFPFNPKDARFIGSPIDLIVFDGYSDKRDDLLIYFVEIKTGKSKLTEIQQKVKKAVLKGNIRWSEINPNDNLNETIQPKLF
jgi:predicted Holliday junction resolvase-like endonuclease